MFQATPTGHRGGMVVLALIGLLVIVGATWWWLSEMRRGPAVEHPDEAVRRAQDPRHRG